MDILTARQGETQVIERGGAMVLEDAPGTLKKVAVLMQWRNKINHDNVDMDLVVYVYNKNGKFRETLTNRGIMSEDGAIIHGGDVVEGDQEDGEWVYIDLEKMNPDLTTIYIAATTAKDGVLAANLDYCTLHLYDLSGDGIPNGKRDDDLDDFEVANVVCSSQRADRDTHGIVMGKLVKVDVGGGYWCLTALGSMHPAYSPPLLAQELTRIESLGENTSSAVWKKEAIAFLEKRIAESKASLGGGGGEGSQPKDKHKKTKYSHADLVAALEANDRMWEAKMAQQAAKIQSLERMLARLANDHGDKSKHMEATIAHIESHKEAINVNQELTINGLEERIIDLVTTKMEEYKKELNERAALLVAGSTSPALGGHRGGGVASASLTAGSRGLSHSYSYAGAGPSTAPASPTLRRANSTFDSVQSMRHARGLGVEMVQPSKRNRSQYVCHVRDGKMCVDYHPFESSKQPVVPGKPIWHG